MGEINEKSIPYLLSLQNFLQDKGYTIEVVFNSNLDDFSMLFYSPAVISTGSSFSFMSGYFSEGIYLTEGHYHENYNGSTSLCTAKFIKRNYSINHSNIKDYNDTEKIIKLLKE
jgi:hypothetical protein